SAAQGRDQREDLLRIADVRPEQGHPGQAAATQLVEHPARRRQARERWDQQRAGQPREGRIEGHPFTAPATSPPTSRRRTTRKKRTTGIVYIVDAAMIGPHCAPPRPKK